MRHCLLFAALLAALTVLPAGPARAVILTIDQVTSIAMNAGFHGGSLVSAIAAAEAESGFDTEAVNNNVHITTAGGVLIPGPGGRPVLASLPTTGRVMLPLGSIQQLPDGRYGKVVSHCRGLWQFNNGVHTRWPTDAQAFDPVSAAACVYAISRHGRDMGKWVVMQTGTAWEAARLARARAAAVARDFSVLRGTVNERTQARVTGGAIRATPAGARIRALHQGDAGTVLSGPVQAAITQGRQTSIKLWWRVQWDSGHTGWVSEDLLVRYTDSGPEQAQPAYAGAPHNGNGVRHDAALTWCTGANTANQRLYFGTTPSLGAADLKLTGLVQSWQPPAALLPYTRYYWRVDTLSGQGAVIPGPLWTFLTRPAAAAEVQLESVVTAPKVPQPGFNFVITCHTRSPAGQPVLVGASLHRTNTTPVSDPPNDVPRFAPTGTGSFTRNFNLPLNTPPGSYTLLVRLVQDYDADGDIDTSEVVITESRTTIFVAPPGPLVDGLAVNPQTMAPGQTATITANVSALPGSSLGLLKLFRAEGEAAPGPWTQLQTRNMNNAAQYAATFTDTPPTIRRYWYAIQAFDNLNRGAPDGPYLRPVSVRVTIGDTRPPVLTWTSPAEGAAIQQNQQISGQMTDNDVIESAAYRMDDGGWETMPTGNWFIFPAPGAGSHRLTIRATDRSGNTTVETRRYYTLPQTGGSDFDEDQLFAGPTDHFPFWQLSMQGAAQVTGGRVEAPGEGSSFSFSRLKQPPVWAQAVEVSFQCGPEGASLRWNRNFFGDLVVRLVRSGPAQWRLESGQSGSPQQVVLSASALTSDARLSILARLQAGQIYCRVVTADTASTLLAESLQNLANITPGELGDFSISGAASGSETVWLDDVSFRALRADDLLRVQRAAVVSPIGTQRNFTMDWTTIPGRVYQLELMDPVTRQWSRTDAPLTAAGVQLSRTVSFPKTRPGVLMRARLLRP